MTISPLLGLSLTSNLKPEEALDVRQYSFPQHIRISSQHQCFQTSKYSSNQNFQKIARKSNFYRQNFISDDLEVEHFLELRKRLNSSYNFVQGRQNRRGGLQLIIRLNTILENERQKKREPDRSFSGQFYWTFVAEKRKIWPKSNAPKT